MKIRTQKFQAIDDSTIEIDRFTVVVGPSNTGKSALIRSIIAVLTNKRGNAFVKKGAENADILLENKGHSVRLIKGKTTEYYLDGVHHPKAGKSTPKDEIARLGILPITAGGSVYYPQIQKQFDRPFIISESSPTVAAELLSASKHNQILTRAIKNAQSDLRKKEAELSLRDTQLKNLKTLVNTVGEIHPRILGTKQTVLEAHISWLAAEQRKKTLVFQRERYRRTKGVLLSLKKAPHTSVPPIPQINKSSLLRAVQERYKRALILSAVSETSKREVPTTQAKPQRTSSLRQLQKKHRFLQAFSTKVQVLSGVPTFQVDPKRTVILRVVRDQHKNLLKKQQQLGEEQASLDHELGEVDAQIAQVLAKIGVCPTCRRSTGLDGMA